MGGIEPHRFAEGGLTDRQQQILYLNEEFPDWSHSDIATCVDAHSNYVVQTIQTYDDLEVPSEFKPRIQRELLSELEDKMDALGEPSSKLKEFHDKISSL